MDSATTIGDFLQDLQERREQAIKRLTRAESAVASAREELAEVERVLATLSRWEVKGNNSNGASEPTTPATIPMRAGKPVRWAAYKQACDALPGQILPLVSILTKTREMFPDMDINPGYASRDLGRHAEYWEQADRGNWLCKWKPEDIF